MSTYKPKVLITGCSDGGTGAGLAIAFHKANLDVYATSRNPEKMSTLVAMGIKTMALDVLSESSIAACAAQIPALDILVNNAGAVTAMPIVDTNLPDAKELFDLNVWSYVAIIRVFLPLLLKSSNAMIVNHTSAQAEMAIPFVGVYGASKAAIGMITQNLRLELQPFDIRVVELRTGEVQTRIIQNYLQNRKYPLPADSIYSPAKEILERLEDMHGSGPSAEEWADSIVVQLLKKNPAPILWSGKDGGKACIWHWIPLSCRDSLVSRMTGLDVVQQLIRKHRQREKL